MFGLFKKAPPNPAEIARNVANAARLETVLQAGTCSGVVVFLDCPGDEKLRALIESDAGAAFFEVIENRIAQADFNDSIPADCPQADVVRAVFDSDNKPILRWKAER